MKKTLLHPRFGEITICRTRRARRISISVRPPDRVRLTLPALCSIRCGMAFVEERSEWIAKMLGRMGEKYPPRHILPPYSTATHELILNPAITDKISSRISSAGAMPRQEPLPKQKPLPELKQEPFPKPRQEPLPVWEHISAQAIMPQQESAPEPQLGKITVTYPQNLPPESQQMQQAIRAAILRALKKEAAALLPPLVESLAAAHGFRYRTVAVRAARSRWGSCSGRDDISLSVYLMLLPRHLIEYIILHELCHTIHKNHSDAFHQLLDRHLGGRERQYIREIRNYRPEIA